MRGVGDPDADWAVGNDDVIYFTAAGRLQGSGSDHGVWRFDRDTGVLTTLARRPVDEEFGDAPGTDASYDSFSNLTVCGDYVAFLAELSDGTIGIFGTDTNGGVIKIAREGDELDGSVVTDLYFSPDTAGESLRETQGVMGLNSRGELAFVADLANDERALVRASFEGNRIVSDPIYVWDGGAGNNDWHGITNGRSNWVDGSGAPRAEPPPVGGPAFVTISAEGVVRVFREGVDITELEVLGGTLEVAQSFSAGSVTIAEGAGLTLQEGDFSVVDLTIRGRLRKETEGDATLASDVIRMTDAVFVVDEGELKVEVTEAILEDTDPAVESGELTLKGGWDFQSEDASIVVDGLGGRLVFESGVISIAKSLEVVTTNNSNVVSWGEQFKAGVLEFRAINGSILTLKGEGNQWLYKPTVIPFELTVKVRLGGPRRFNGFFVDLAANERLLIGGKLENFYETNIYGGGIREVGGTFLNHGLLRIPRSDLGHLDVTSLGEVRQSADVRYGRISLLPGSRYDMNRAKLLPGGTGLRALDFQAGSKLAVSGPGTSRVEGLAGGLNHFGSDLEVFGGATLELKGLNSKSLVQTNREFVYRVHKLGSLVLDDFEFRFGKVSGGGGGESNECNRGRGGLNDGS